MPARGRPRTRAVARARPAPLIQAPPAVAPPAVAPAPPAVAPAPPAVAPAPPAAAAPPRVRLRHAQRVRAPAPVAPRSRSRSPPVLIRPPADTSDDDESRVDRWERMEALMVQQGQQNQLLQTQQNQAVAPHHRQPGYAQGHRPQPAAALGAPEQGFEHQQYGLPPPVGYPKRPTMPTNMFIDPPTNPGPPFHPAHVPIQQVIQQGAWAGVQFPNQGYFDNILTVGITAVLCIRA